MPGERVELSDRSRLFSAVVDEASGAAVSFRVEQEIPVRVSTTRLELYAAIIKFPRFEWMIEKATELGAAAIAPVVAERSDVGLCRAAVKRLDRWRRLSEEAAQQCRRLAPPELVEPVSLEDALGRAADQKLFFDFEAPPLASLLAEPAAGNFALFCGPEGGWSDHERELFASAGTRAAGLGHTVLRAETAAVAGLAVAAQALDL